LKDLGRLLGPNIIIRRMELIVEEARRALWTHLTLGLGRVAFPVVLRFALLDVGRVALLRLLWHADHQLLGAKRFRGVTSAIHQAHQERGLFVNRPGILLNTPATLAHARLVLRE